MNKAFTLVETLVTLALVSILIGIGASVSYKATQRSQVDQAGQKLQNYYETARAYALAGKKISCTGATKLGGWGVFVNTNNNRLELREYCAPLPSSVAGLSCPSAVCFINSFYKLGTGVSVDTTPSPNPIIFKPLGQGVYVAPTPGTPFNTFTTAILTGSGYKKPVTISSQGQISAQDLIVLPTSTPVVPTNTPTIIPTPSQTPIFILNMATNQSCSLQCQTMVGPSSSCISVGQDVYGADGGYRAVSGGVCQNAFAGNCNTSMINTGVTDVAYSPRVCNWTWCACTNPGAPTSTPTPTNTPVPPNSQFVTQVVPSTMTHGQVYGVQVKFKNTGTTNWLAGSYGIGSQNPPDNATWGLNRVSLSADVVSGANGSFSFNVTAPSVPGSYTFQWKTVQLPSTWFGTTSTLQTITVN